MQRNSASDSLRSWLIALRAPKLGRAAVLKALASGGISELFSSSSQLPVVSRAYLRNPDMELLRADTEWLDDGRHCLLTFDNPDYPAVLKRIPDPPVALWLAGDVDLLWQPQIAIIGSRNPTRGGLDNAAAFARHLAKEGFVITSGMASGVDSAAHKAALNVSSTIAVLGTGVDVVYPVTNRKLSAEIAAAGLLVSEFPLGTTARPSHFPSRNRIISGLSLGVLVVEAGVKSGTLITTRLAVEQGREVFAIPGSIHNPMSKGCHRLIRDGAKLVETGADVIQELGAVAAELAQELHQRLQEPSLKTELEATSVQVPESANQARLGLPDDPEYQKLWSNLSFDPQAVEKIIRLSGLTPQAVSSMLLVLELKGMVETHPGGAFSRLQ